MTDADPDVSIRDLVVFEKPDVRISDFVDFQAAEGPAEIRPDIRLDELTVFSTPEIISTPDVSGPEFLTPEVPHKGQFREWMESLVGTIAFVLVFTTLIAQATQVPTESMKPTILVGDHFFLDKVAFPGNYPEKLRHFLPRRTIRRGDIVAFKPPSAATMEKTPFVKRVIAVGGDTIEMRERNVYVNGHKLDEMYKIYSEYYPDTSRDNFSPQVVPPDSFFVMGDNRDNSFDSRYWGFVDRNAIIGKPLFVYWSYESDPFNGGSVSFREWLQGYTSTALHFFTRTRWFRFGTVIQ